MLEYRALSSVGQIRAIRRALTPLLDAHGLEAKPLRLAYHAYNTTFRLPTSEGEAAIRVYSGSNRTFEEVDGEIAWTRALYEDGRVRAPEPLDIFGDGPMARVQVDGMGREIAVVAYRWLEGRHVGAHRPPRSGFLLGQAMRRLHDMARDWSLPSGTSRPILRNAIDSLPWRLGESGPFREVFERANVILARQAPLRQLVHFDLHFGNVKVWRGEMSVFDFDDSLFASPGADVAQAVFYLRREIGSGAERAFWEGLGRTLADLELSPAEFEILMGGRALLLATDLSGTQSAGLAPLAPKYIEATRIRLEHLLKTGRYDGSVAKIDG